MTSGLALGGAALNHRWQEDTAQKEREDRLRETWASLRRDAYARYLIASERLRDYMLVQSPPEDPVDPTDTEKLLGRLRDLWVSGDEHVNEYVSSQMQIELLAGAEVSTSLEELTEWFDDQIRLMLIQQNPLAEKGLTQLEEKRKPLIQAMRNELEVDFFREPAEG